MLSILRIGLAQIQHATDEGGDPQAAIEAAMERHLEVLERAARVGVQLLGFPELCSTPWFPGSPDDRWLGSARQVDDDAGLARLRRMAGMHRCVVVFPFLERATDDRVHSSAAVIDADGTLLGVVRRQHLTGREAQHLAPGRGQFPVFETAAGRLGVVLGYDMHVPEVPRILGLRGAELILFPTATTADRPRILQEAEPLSVAAQNACWVGLVNRVGTELLRGPDTSAQVTEYSGGSYLADARGRFHARASRDREALIRADLPLSRLRADRKRTAPHAHRRPGIYHLLTGS